MEAYELEFGTLSRSPTDPTRSVVTVTNYLPASGRQIAKLAWTSIRDGGCEQLTATIVRPFDNWGGIDHGQDVTLRINGQVWWRGYVTAISPKLAVPETIDIVASGYIHRAQDATFTWSFGRQGLKSVGTRTETQRAVGEIAGVVQAVVALMPLIGGTQEYDETGTRTDAHPMCDGPPQIDVPAYRPEALVFQNRTPHEIFKELAEMAGNFEWGVDEHRTFYFRRAQALTAHTALYGAARWWDGSGNADTTHGYYGDETYQDPQAEVPFLDIQEDAVFLIGSDVQTYNATEESTAVKNVLIVFGLPARMGDPTPVVTVADAAGLERWKRRIVARVAAPSLTATADMVQWAAQRLRMLAKPTLSGGVKAVGHERLIRPTGAARVINGAAELIERIQEVSYELADSGVLTVTVALGYTVPPDRALAEQLRRDATLNQQLNAEEAAAFFLQERHAWPHDTTAAGASLWTATLT